MADITYTAKATEKRASPGIVAGKGNANVLQVLCTATVEVAAAAADGSTYRFGTIPSNARLSGLSMVYWDDLTAAGAPTLDLGLGSVDSNVTSDPDALSNGHDVTSAGSAAAITSTAIETLGNPAWDFVNGVSADPGGQLDVYGSIVDAAADAGGTVTVEIYGYLD